VKIKIKKILKEGPDEARQQNILRRVMSKYDIEVGKQLGEGQYGKVFYGVSDQFGPVAIKMIARGMPNTRQPVSFNRELRNYQKVSDARSKSTYIAKHFPEVYHVDEKTVPEFGFIVMEILDVLEGYQYETISNLFGGFNTALAPYEDEKEASGTFRSRANRLYTLFKNKEAQKSILEDVDAAFYGIEDVILPVVKEFFSYLDGYVSRVKDNNRSMQALSFMPLSQKAQDYLTNHFNGSEKTMFQDAPWLLTLIVNQLTALLDHDPTEALFLQHHESLIRYWVEYIRKSSPIGLKDRDPRAFSPEDEGAPDEQWKAFKEASSIKKAISDLKQIAGIQVKDVHDKNVMVRPQTGDLVIMDLGLFSG
jgi:serine/threonine protein kinase